MNTNTFLFPTPDYAKSKNNGLAPLSELHDTAMTVQVEMKYSYGLQTFYPVCEKAKIFAKISGNKTLTKPCRDAIQELGYTIEVSVPEVKL
jgi:hypothetical protein